MNDKENEKLLKITVQLKDKTITKFKQVKDYLGLENDTEVFRFLIADYHRKNIKEKEQK